MIHHVDRIEAGPLGGAGEHHDMLEQLVVAHTRKGVVRNLKTQQLHVIIIEWRGSQR